MSQEPSSELERVLCAAIWVDDGAPYPHQPTETGVVVCGLRHHAILIPVSLLVVSTKEGFTLYKVQGFLTNRGRFVNRYEAYEVAERAGQLVGKKPHKVRKLYSEDLY